MKIATQSPARLALTGLFIAALTAACGPTSKQPQPDGCDQGGVCQANDGCCPRGCNTLTDPDCVPACGNGVIEPGETCEADCPRTCDDENACTADRLVGDPDRCVVACEHTPLEACESGDGCCPAGCDARLDADCSSSCGNGVIEPGETCEGMCPDSCDDAQACTQDVMTGALETCNVACDHEPIVWCGDGDGCCPEGCSEVTDSDCAPVCGNGVIEPGETCEPDLGGCPAQPADCDDGDACTNDLLIGRAAECTSACEHAPVVSCIDADGCCPEGCNANTDTDCQPVCGNGVTEPTETCDGDCPRIPEDCDEGDACIRANVFGDPDGCHSYCGDPYPILNCGHGDGCCPEGCNQFTDSDCPACPTGEHPCDQGCCGWQQQTVELTPTSSRTGLAFDTQDRAHLVYSVPQECFHYARYSSGAWQLIQGPQEVGDCEHLVFRLDAQDRPHVAWYDRDLQTVRYATSQDGAWTVSTVAQVGNYPTSHHPLAMVISPAGGPTVAYRDEVTDRLKVASFGNAWIATTIDAADQAGMTVDLAMDAQGRLHVAYTVLSEYAVFYGHRSGQGWNLERIGYFVNNDSYLSLALDSSDQARVAFHKTEGLTVSSQTDQGWASEQVWTCHGCRFFGLELVIDTQDSAHLVYRDWDACLLVYALETDDGWVSMDLHHEATSSSRPSLALDEAGTPAVGTARYGSRTELWRW